MKYFELTDKEQQILSDFEKGEFKSVVHSTREKKHYQELASVTLKKTKNINIRMSEKDLQKIKAKAVETGIPYQTLVTSVLHRFASAGPLELKNVWF